MTIGLPYTLRQGSGSTNYGRVKPSHTTINDGFRYPVSIIEAHQGDPKLHPTQKPVTLMEYLINTYTNEGETVLDNCMGSGTTGVACMNTGRKFIGIEMDEDYFEIAKRRIENSKNLSQTKNQ